MKNKKIFGVAIAIIAIVIIVSMSLSANKKEKKLTIGMIAGMSGEYAVVGENFAKGVEVAQDEWNMSHPNQIVTVVKEDDGFDAKKGLSAYRKLTSINKIDGLINMTTITIDALYSEVSKTDMPIALGFEQGIEAKKDNVVQLWPGTVPAEAKLGQYIKEKGYKNLVIFVDSSSSAFERFADGFKQGYGMPVQEVKISNNKVDIKSSALKALSYKPDAIVFIITPTSGALLVKELKSLSKDDIQYVFDANIQTGFSDYEKILGNGSILDGSIIYTVPNVYREEFSRKFKSKFGSDPMIGSETGYNAFKLLVNSYNSDKKKWVENMQNSSFVGADGQIVFDENGIRIPELKIGVIKDGKLPN